MGIMDDWFGFDSGGSYNPWLAAIAANNAQAERDRIAAANAQAAANAATANTATTAVNAAPAPAAGPTFDPAPYQNIVNSGFSQFTPEWYANQYQAAYTPWESGVNTQYGTARDYLTAGLTAQGQQDSPLGRGLFQQLDSLRDQNLTAGQTAAQNYQGGLETSVNNARTGLYDSIAQGGDNSTIGARTTAAATPIYNTTAPASTLGENVFGSVVDPYTSGVQSGTSLAFGAGEGSGGLNLAGGGGGPEASTRVVGATAPATNNTNRRRRA